MRPYRKLAEVPRKRHMRFQANGRLAYEAQFGRLRFARHDYIVIPRGTVYRIDRDQIGEARMLCLEVSGFVDVPDRYRARNGQLTEMAPYSERDFRGPDELEVASGPVEVWL